MHCLLQASNCCCCCSPVNWAFDCVLALPVLPTHRHTNTSKAYIALFQLLLLLLLWHLRCASRPFAVRTCLRTSDWQTSLPLLQPAEGVVQDILRCRCLERLPTSSVSLEMRTGNRRLAVASKWRAPNGASPKLRSYAKHNGGRTRSATLPRELFVAIYCHNKLAAKHMRKYMFDCVCCAKIFIFVCIAVCCCMRLYVCVRATNCLLFKLL